MERLTRRTPAGVGVLWACGETLNCKSCPGPCVTQDKANTRLADYEDTGMEPEEINQLREFTESATNTTMAHIYELVQAEKEGRLEVKPPRVVKATAPAGQYSEETLQALERMADKAHREG